MDQVDGALRFLSVAGLGFDTRCHPDLDAPLPLAGTFPQHVTILSKNCARHSGHPEFQWRNWIALGSSICLAPVMGLDPSHGDGGKNYPLPSVGHRVSRARGRWPYW